MLNDIGFALWFLLPGACANVAPIFAAALPYLKTFSYPIDGGKIWRGKRILGAHKTWRGITAGVLVSSLVFFWQINATGSYDWAATLAGPVDYSTLPWILGPLFGLGALGGDALKSFVKRRLDIKPGAKWVPFDQVDYILGSITVTLPFVVVGFKYYVWMLVVWFLAHLVASYIGWLLKLKEQPI